MRRALENSEARFQRVVEAAPNAMVMIAESGLIEMVNTQAERLFGYPRSELLGQPVEILVPERFRGHHPGLREAFFGEPRSRAMGAGRDLFGLRKDGSEFPVEIGLNPIEMEEGAMVLSAIVDISDRKHKEQRIEAALKEKELLLGEVHHRVKNNLQIIQSLLYLQASKINDETVTAILMESQNRIKSMALIHQTLYQSKDFERVDFGLFLDTLAPNLVSSYSVDPGRIGLSIDAADVQLPIHVAIPCGLVVNELISNALKHGFPDGQRGHIEVALAREPNDDVVLSVSDDGIGIPDALEIPNADTLGLQMVYLLSEQLRAAMEVRRSAPTRFRLQFPVAA
ncbi:MAG: histidine kinase dimerization/phosphoacceptor domain -containing protein [Caulobacteraceae bacterium]|nr:histidine kinase dimerization/phosphoacceptor domain -containing protein [Caulobacteraceae bacterium]